ncbi:hypothetical protein [Nonomuraea sp. NPDC050691]|uniref:hypothetical protein n=1 Tax=Nonomuraea sp. NPDC050691 TaxID=3155661 RepID=UPI0034098EBD
MKRIVTGLALAAAATLITTAPAHATAAKDPAAAVKKQYVAGKGVSFTERTTIFQGRQRQVFVRRNGTFQFGASGITASDITGKFNIKASDLGEDADSEVGKMMRTPERVITVGNATYLSGSLWASAVPEGKTWYKAPSKYFGGLMGVYGQPLNIVGEPATLKTLLKGAKPAAGGYTGKITVGELRKLSRSARANFILAEAKGKQLKAVISWKLAVDAKGLPTRLTTVLPGKVLSAQAPKDAGFSVETSLTGWGSTVKITAPPADTVATDLKDGQEPPTSMTIPLGSIAQ